MTKRKPKELIIGELLIRWITPEELCEKINRLDDKTIRMFNEAVKQEWIARGRNPYEPLDNDEKLN